jgi:hypothetical protein
MYAYTIYHFCVFRQLYNGDKQFADGTVRICIQPHKDGFYDQVRSLIAGTFDPAITTNDEFVITSLTKLFDMYRD